MKKLTVTFAFLAMCSSLHAWEFPRNPDRFPSIGLNMGNGIISGHRAEISQPNSILTMVNSGPLHDYVLKLGADLRVPVNDQLTISLGYENISTDSHYSRDGNVYRVDDELNGYNISLGVRLYLNK